MSAVLHRFKRMGWFISRPQHPKYLAVGLLFLMLLQIPLPFEAAEHDEKVKTLQSQTQAIEQRRRDLRLKRYQKLREAQTVTQSIVKNQRSLESTKSSLVWQYGRLNETRTRMGYLVGEIDRTVGETARLSQAAGQRLKNLYMEERISLLQMILDARDVTTLLDRLYYQQRIVAQDKAILLALRDKTSYLHQKRSELDVQKSSISDAIGKIKVFRDRISDQISQDRRLRDKYANDAAYYERAERELLNESNAIQRQIQALLSSSSGKKDVVGSTGAFAWPLSGRVTSGYGYRWHPVHHKSLMHTGLDISGGYGASVAAADGGEVYFVGWRGGYGKVVMINHGLKDGRNFMTLYGHLSQWRVSTGQTVQKGQVIGNVGATGVATGPHLHFEIRVNGATVNPQSYL